MRNAVEEFAKLDNESEEFVRTRLAQGVYGRELVPIVEEWLRSKENSRKHAAASRAETREEQAIALAWEANQIAREAVRTASEANKIARRAKTIALWTAIAAALAAVAAVLAVKW